MRVRLRVRLEPFLARPVAHAVADRVAEIGRQPAALDLEHLVPAPRLVKAERRPVRCLRERVLELVAVVEDRLGGNDLLERRLGDPSEPAQRVLHLPLLLLELRLVREILEAAAAARGIVRARRLDALRPRREHVDARAPRRGCASPSSRARARGRREARGARRRRSRSAARRRCRRTRATRRRARRRRHAGRERPPAEGSRSRPEDRATRPAEAREEAGRLR